MISELIQSVYAHIITITHQLYKEIQRPSNNSDPPAVPVLAFPMVVLWSASPPPPPGPAPLPSGTVSSRGSFFCGQQTVQNGQWWGVNSTQALAELRRE